MVKKGNVSIVKNLVLLTRAVESESGARAYFEESGVGVGRKKIEESESGVGRKKFEESESENFF